MLKFIFILLVALCFEAVGVVFLSKGLHEIQSNAPSSIYHVINLVKKGIVNPHIIFGVALEAVFFFMLLYLMSHNDVSFIWPMTALGFVITTLAAKIFLNEQVSFVRWMGVILIVIGAALVSWSDKVSSDRNFSETQKIENSK
jgi:drug/metabolite transporter (DMT)-like permease